MNKEEYETKWLELQIECKEKISDVKNEYKGKLKELEKEFSAINQYNVGDIVEYEQGKGEVVSVRVNHAWFNQPPDIVHTILEYTKKGQPNKRGKKRYLSHDEIIGKCDG